LLDEWTDTILVTPAGGQVFCYSSVDETKEGITRHYLIF